MSESVTETDRGFRGAPPDHASTPQRIWLDWRRPCLPQASAWLVNRHRSGQCCDLSRVLCVLPGHRAGRLLLSHLLEACESEGLHLFPPNREIPGAMADTLLLAARDLPAGSPAPAAPATASEQRLAWVEALRACDGAILGGLIPHPPDADNFAAWSALAAELASLHEELARNLISFGQVVQILGKRSAIREEDRWRALSEVQRRYEAALMERGLTDPHRARWAALPTVVHASRRFDHVVLIGVVDMNELPRRAVRELGDRVTALIHATESEQDGFDACGCIIPEYWSARSIPIEDRQIHVCEGPDDQCQSVLRSISQLNPAPAPAEITIGLGDESMGAQLCREAQWAGVDFRIAAGEAMQHSAPYRLIEAIGRWLEDTHFARFASLLRHPDVEQWLLRTLERKHPESPDGETQHTITDWLSVLDRYFTDHLQQHAAGEWLGKRANQMALVWNRIDRLIKPLRGRQRRIADWAEPILTLLRSVYGNLETGPGGAGGAGETRSATARSCLLLRDTLIELAQTRGELQPTLRAVDAIGFILAAAREQSIPQEPAPDAVNVLGWQELHLDDAPHLIVANVNDGHIPRAIAGHMFLPNSLRIELGIMNDARRCSADRYMLEAMQHSRANVTLIAGRVDELGDPILPSRLLLACDRAHLPRRVRLFSDESLHVRPMRPFGMPAPAERSRFVVPPLPADAPLPNSMSVTAFGSYIRCPYRFALEKLCGLKVVNDQQTELDPMNFGSFVHDVLQDFGENLELRESQDAATIEKFLFEALANRAHDVFGSTPAPAVRIQLERIRQRLRGFARCQSALRDEGWIIKHCELKLENEYELDVPGQDSMLLRGRIDRIDRHETTGAWRVIDYKTGEKGLSPYAAHHGGNDRPQEDEPEWKNLQLPLYDYLVRAFGIEGEIELGYIVLPKQADGVQYLAAEWSRAQIDHALNEAREIVRRIRRREFEPDDSIDSVFDTFARICQTMTFRDDEEGDERDDEFAAALREDA